MNQHPVHHARSTERGATAVEFGLTVGLIATLAIVGFGYVADNFAALVRAAGAVL